MKGRGLDPGGATGRPRWRSSILGHPTRSFHATHASESESEAETASQRLAYDSSTNCPGNRVRYKFIGDDGGTLVFLTNHLRFAANTVARIYKDRWQIELFFKALKQNLTIKTFVGTGPNAVRLQIWTALVAILLLKYLQFTSRLAWSLSNLVALLRWNLFTYRDLWAWLDDPFETPPQGPQPAQLALALG